MRLRILSIGKFYTRASRRLQTFCGKSRRIQIVMEHGWDLDESLFRITQTDTFAQKMYFNCDVHWNDQLQINPQHWDARWDWFLENKEAKLLSFTNEVPWTFISESRWRKTPIASKLRMIFSSRRWCPMLSTSQWLLSQSCRPADLNQWAQLLKSFHLNSKNNPPSIIPISVILVKRFNWTERMGMKKATHEDFKGLNNALGELVSAYGQQNIEQSRYVSPEKLEHDRHEELQIKIQQYCRDRRTAEFHAGCH